MLKCSFCQKTEDQVEKLVAGPNVYICNGCVAIAARLMLERPKTFFKTLWDYLVALTRKFIETPPEAARPGL